MNIELVTLKKNKVKNGDLVEFISAKDLDLHDNLFGHLFLVTFKGNKTIRGNHYHEKQHEYYIVLSGKLKVMLFDIKSKEEKTLILSSDEGNYQRLRIGPNIAHASCSMTSKSTMLSYYAVPYNSKKLDTIKYVLIKDK